MRRGLTRGAGTGAGTAEVGIVRAAGGARCSTLAGVKKVPRISVDPAVMGGRPCIRGLRVTLSTVLRSVAGGHSAEAILREYLYLERADLDEALAFAAWLAESPAEALTSL